VTALTVTATDRIVVGGEFVGQVSVSDGARSVALSGEEDLFLAVFDAQANLLGATSMTSGKGAKRLAGLAALPNGEVVVAGQFAGTTTFGPSGAARTFTAAGESDIFVARVSPSPGL
jgi:hypothetical protein